jgi:hypothetical protein
VVKNFSLIVLLLFSFSDSRAQGSDCSKALVDPGYYLTSSLIKTELGEDIFRRLSKSIVIDHSRPYFHKWSRDELQTYSDNFPELGDTSQLIDNMIFRVGMMLSEKFPEEPVEFSYASLRLQNSMMGVDSVHRDSAAYEYFTVTIALFGRGTRIYSEKEFGVNKLEYEVKTTETLILSGDERLGRDKGTLHAIPDGERLVLVLNFKRKEKNLFKESPLLYTPEASMAESIRENLNKKTGNISGFYISESLMMVGYGEELRNYLYHNQFLELSQSLSPQEVAFMKREKVIKRFGKRDLIMGFNTPESTLYTVNSPDLGVHGKYLDGIVSFVTETLKKAFPEESLEPIMVSLRYTAENEFSRPHVDDMADEYITATITFFGEGTIIYDRPINEKVGEQKVKKLTQGKPGQLVVFNGRSRAENLESKKPPHFLDFTKAWISPKIPGTPHGAGYGERVVLIINYNKR